MNDGIAQGSWADWVRAFEKVYADPLHPSKVECPSCGQRKLKIAFTGDASTMIGYASFWCEACLNGIFTSRLHVPSEVDPIPFGLGPVERVKLVPNYRVIPPDLDDDGEDVESFVF